MTSGAEQSNVHDQSESIALDVEMGRRYVEALTVAGAKPRGALMFAQVRGLLGEPPVSLRKLDKTVSAERVRQLVREVESGAAVKVGGLESAELQQIRANVSAAIDVIYSYIPGADDTLRRQLEHHGIKLQSASSLIRLADVLGIPHRIRLTSWESRPMVTVDEVTGATELVTPESRRRNVSIPCLVPDSMPEVAEAFLTFARKYSRGVGVVGARHLAERFGEERGVALTEAESEAMLSPFAVHLGRHDGDEYFAFVSSANEFLRKAAVRVRLFGHCSFELLVEFHRRFNRSLYIEDGTRPPVGALKELLELSGYRVDGDSVTVVDGKSNAGGGRGPTATQALMVSVFKQVQADQGDVRQIPRADLMAAFKRAGILPLTAQMYLGNQGLFICKGGKCRLATEKATVEPARQDTESAESAAA